MSFSPQAPPPDTEHVCTKKYPTTSSYECNLVCNCSLLPSLFLIYLFSLVHADTLAEPLFFVLKKHDAISVMQLFFICTSKCSELSCLVLCILKYFEQVYFTHLSPYRRCLAVVRHCVNSWAFATGFMLFKTLYTVYLITVATIMQVSL